MKAFKQVMGALSRDMLFLHGHVVSVRGLEGATQRSPTYPAIPKKIEPSRKAASHDTCKECTA